MVYIVEEMLGCKFKTVVVVFILAPVASGFVNIFPPDSTQEKNSNALRLISSLVL